MDISKAFDSVKHSTLIKKLGALGVAGSSLDWFQSYPLDRTQYVEMTHLSNKMQLGYNSLGRNVNTVITLFIL